MRGEKGTPIPIILRFEHSNKSSMSARITFLYFAPQLFPSIGLAKKKIVGSHFVFFVFFSLSQWQKQASRLSAFFPPRFQPFKNFLSFFRPLQAKSNLGEGCYCTSIEAPEPPYRNQASKQPRRRKRGRKL